MKVAVIGAGDMGRGVQQGGVAHTLTRGGVPLQDTRFTTAWKLLVPAQA